MRAARERLARLEEAVREQVTEDQERRALRVVIGQLQDFADTVNGGLDNADWTTRREIIRAVVKQIEIDEDDVSILYKVSPDGIVARVAERSLQHRWRGDGRVGVEGRTAPGCTGRWRRTAVARSSCRPDISSRIAA